MGGIFSIESFRLLRDLIDKNRPSTNVIIGLLLLLVTAYFVWGGLTTLNDNDESAGTFIMLGSVSGGLALSFLFGALLRSGTGGCLSAFVAWLAVVGLLLVISG